ncbi:MAG: ABC transporter substrate-binding protein [Chloroflexi bacterium]|nr:ABC transporter substrate-binding protein [Chloroflexota bacterium]
MGHIADDVRVTTFGGVSAFPILVAERLGLADAHGLVLTTTRTTDSTALRDDLLAGRIDVAHAAPDNVFAWADAASAGAAHAATGAHTATGADAAADDATTVAAWLAGSNGPIALVARTASAIAELRGARIGVDAPTSGFAPILLRLLATADLTEADVELVALGATRGRFTALTDGRIDASMLTLPWSALATRDGRRVLADHALVAPGLLTSAAIVRRDRLAACGPVLERYREMLMEALAWLRDPASRETAADWLADDLDLERHTALDILDALADPSTGWPSSVDLDRRALDAAHALRASIGRAPARPAAAYLVVR